MELEGWEDIYYLNPILQECMNQIQDCMILHPPRDMIFRAFELTKMRDIKVVIIGQDPYPNENANGLSFSAEKVPKSLGAIFNRLLSLGLINYKPTNGDLTAWARRGVLLLNMALTTTNESNKHTFWHSWTKEVVRVIDEKVSPIFFLWGNEAQKVKVTNTLTYKHPSPMAGPNWDCDHFLHVDIDWDPRQVKHIMCATDGSAINTDKSADGGIGIYFPPTICGVNNLLSMELNGRVKAPCSNYYAELLAIVKVMEYVIKHPCNEPYKYKLGIVTDSMSVITALVDTSKSKPWKSIPNEVRPDSSYHKLRERAKNAMSIIDVVFYHVNSHVSNKIKDNATSTMREMYAMNEKADTLAEYGRLHGNYVQ